MWTRAAQHVARQRAASQAPPSTDMGDPIPLTMDDPRCLACVQDDNDLLRNIPADLPPPICASEYQPFDKLDTHLCTDAHRFVLYLLHSMSRERLVYTNLGKLDAASLSKLASLLLMGIKQLGPAKHKDKAGAKEDPQALFEMHDGIVATLTKLHPDLAAAFKTVLVPSAYTPNRPDDSDAIRARHEGRCPLTLHHATEVSHIIPYTLLGITAANLSFWCFVMLLLGARLTRTAFLLCSTGSNNGLLLNATLAPLYNSGGFLLTPTGKIADSHYVVRFDWRIPAPDLFCGILPSTKNPQIDHFEAPYVYKKDLVEERIPYQINHGNCYMLFSTQTKGHPLPPQPLLFIVHNALWNMAGLVWATYLTDDGEVIPDGTGAVQPMPQWKVHNTYPLPE
ncbi:hypothetical protein EDC01DRAFT_269141 [Geopyxis carbonaria]|nr:hypothetical protein EDC01DRAFT_269141 [Geopyxis carbonaria]